MFDGINLNRGTLSGPIDYDDPCKRVRCRNGGSCVIDDTVSEGYRCECVPGTWGALCKKSA